MNNPSSSGASDSLCAYAESLMEIGRYADAVPLLLQALSCEPQDAQILCRLSLSHYFLGNYKEASSFAKQAMNTAPEQEWGFRLQSIILLSRGNPRQSLAAAEEAVRLDPRNAATLYTLVRAQIHTGRRKLAKKTACTLLELHPDSSWAHEALALVALSMHRWREAENHCLTILKIDPLSYSALNIRGISARRMRHSQEAVFHFYEAARHMPINPLIQQNLLSAMQTYLLDTPLTIFGVLFLLQLININNIPIGESATIYHVEALESLGILGSIFGIIYLFRAQRVCSLPAHLRLWVQAHKKQLYPGAAILSDHRARTKWKRSL